MSYLLVTRAEMPLLEADECAVLHGEDDLKTVLMYAGLRDIRKMLGTVDCGALTIEHAGDTAQVSWSRTDNYVSWVAAYASGDTQNITTAFEPSFVAVLKHWQRRRRRMRPR